MLPVGKEYGFHDVRTFKTLYAPKALLRNNNVLDLQSALYVLLNPALAPIIALLRTGCHIHTQLRLTITYLTAKVILFLGAITLLLLWLKCLVFLLVALAIEVRSLLL